MKSPVIHEAFRQDCELKGLHTTGTLKHLEPAGLSTYTHTRNKPHPLLENSEKDS